jgi:hypothetical protein
MVYKGAKMNIEELHTALIELPFVSETRVPYTYHHDHARRMNWLSRGEIAVKVRDTSKEQLYAGCLLYLIHNHSIEMLKAFKEELWMLYQWAEANFQEVEA